MAVEVEQVVLTNMEYAMKSLSLLSPRSLSKCVSVSATMTQQLLSRPASKPRPFRVCNWDRSIRKGIVADSLGDLMNKAQDALLLSDAVTLVLDEDGTGVDTEDFFQSLESGAVFMALTKGQTWKTSQLLLPSQSQETWTSITAERVASYCPADDVLGKMMAATLGTRLIQKSGYHISLSTKPQKKIDVARISFDLYKTHPQDFIGCVNVKATFYGTYTVSYDLQCYSAKRVVKEALRWTLFTMQATGHVLLGTSCYMQQLLEPSEKVEEEKVAPGLRDLIPFYPRRILPASH